MKNNHFLKISLLLSILILLIIHSMYNVNATTNSDLTTTSTPIKHLIVIFQENVSFDHYFATYPDAMNLPDEAPFYASSNTPTINGLSELNLKNNTN